MQVRVWAGSAEALGCLALQLPPVVYGVIDRYWKQGLAALDSF